VRPNKEKMTIIQYMEVEIRKKGNCISQYNTLAEKEHINVINNSCKSKRGFTELRRESGVSFGLYWCELWTETHSVILSVLLWIIVIMHVAVRKLLSDQYTFCTGIPLHFPRYTINHTSALIISILLLNIISVQHKLKDRHPSCPCHSTVILHSAPDSDVEIQTE